jgi:hypothetical protein
VTKLWCSGISCIHRRDAHEQRAVAGCAFLPIGAAHGSPTVRGAGSGPRPVCRSAALEKPRAQIQAVPCHDKIDRQTTVNMRLARSRPMTNDRPASWRMPSLQQMERLASQPPPRTTEPAPGESPDAWWDSVLSDPRATGKPWLPIQRRRLSEIPRHLLRVECLRCLRIVEIQKADALRLYGPHAVWKDVGTRLLDNTCQHRTGRLEEDGCWPSWIS